MDTVHVKIADLAVKKDDGVLVTFGLGSCVGVALYDKRQRVGGLAHILLNDSSKFVRPGTNSFNPAKFADTAVPLLVEKMLEAGAGRRSLVATLVGGASLFNFNSESGGVGEKNIEATRAKLLELRIPVEHEAVGGACGRTMRLFVSSGEIQISTVGKGVVKS